MRLAHLKNIQEPSFFEELFKAPKKLVPKQENLFYKYVLSHFEEPNKISEKKGKVILEILCHCFYESDERISIFVKQQYMLLLPFYDDRFTDQIFDILYIIAEKHPSAFDDQYELGPVFSHLLKINSRKILTILNVLSNGFGDIESPWNVFDVLFKYWKRFYKECPDSYITLIVFLCRLDQSFLQGRGSICYNRIIQLLNTENDDNLELIKILYSGICKLYDCDPSIAEDDTTKSKSVQKKVQNDVILRHIKIESLQAVIVSYLLRITLDVDDEDSLKIVEILLNLAKTSDKACFIIFHLAENDNVSEYLAKKLSLWLTEPLTTQQNTIILLLIVMRNQKLRKKISTRGEIMTFITKTIESDPSFISPLMKIMRKLYIDELFVESLYDNNIIALLIKTARNLKSEDQESCALLIFSIFCKIEYNYSPPNFSSICNYIIFVLKKQNSNMNRAAAIMMNYAHFDQCKIFFKNKNVLDLLNEIDGDKTFRTIRRKLAKELS